MREPLPGGLEVGCREFYAGEPAACVLAGCAGGAQAHERVEDGCRLRGHAQERLQQGNGLFRQAHAALVGVDGLLEHAGQAARVRPVEPLLDAEEDNSLCRVNSPRIGRAEGLCQTTMLRQTQPPARRASVTLGNCRQSVKAMQGPPGLVTRWHSVSQSVVHRVNDRQSRLSSVNEICLFCEALF